MLLDLGEIQRYKGQQANCEPPFITGVRLFRTEAQEVLTKGARDQAALRSGDTRCAWQGKGEGLDKADCVFRGQVANRPCNEQTGYLPSRGAGKAGGRCFRGNLRVYEKEDS